MKKLISTFYCHEIKDNEILLKFEILKNDFGLEVRATVFKDQITQIFVSSISEFAIYWNINMNKIL